MDPPLGFEACGGSVCMRMCSVMPMTVDEIVVFPVL